MNKYQDALNIVKGYYVITKRDMESEEIKTLQKLVDKETPMKVENYRGIWEEARGKYACPRCHRIIELTQWKQPYRCDSCGQIIDWSK